MSATRDPSEKVSFLFTPAGQAVQKARESRAHDRGRVLKSSNRRESPQRPGLVRQYRVRDLPASVEPSAPSAIPASLVQQLQTSDFRLKQQNHALNQLQANLKEFQNIQKRFQFLLLELEELLKD